MNIRGTSRQKPDDQPARSAGRKTAEWVSLALSAIIILALGGYLLFKAVQANEPFVPLEVHAQFDRVREVNGRFILPVFIANRGARTLRDAKVEVRHQGSGSSPETTDLVIDYLGERSEQKAYFYFDENPETLKVEVRAVSYRLD